MLLDDRADEIVVDPAGRDEHAEIDRSRGGGEQALAIDVGEQLAARDGGVEHRRELVHPGVEIGPRIFGVGAGPELDRDPQDRRSRGRFQHFNELAQDGSKILDKACAEIRHYIDFAHVPSRCR